MSDPFLQIVSGSRSGSRIDIRAAGLLVGRDADADVPLLDDESSSRRHARFINVAAGDVLVEDLGSTNGTFVNGTRVVQPVLLRDRDVIRVGDTDLQFFDGRSASSGDSWPADTQGGGVAVGGSVHAQQGSIGAIGKVAGDVDMSRRTVTAEPGGYAAGRDVYHSQRYDYDASGLGVITRSRGTARLLLVVGTLIAFAGFALFAYPIVNGIVNIASSGSASSEASRRCDELYDMGTPQWIECQQEASQLGGDFPKLTPWLPAGVGLLFAGMVISVLGLFMIRSEP